MHGHAIVLATGDTYNSTKWFERKADKSWPSKWIRARSAPKMCLLFVLLLPIWILFQSPLLASLLGPRPCCYGTLMCCCYYSSWYYRCRCVMKRELLALLFEAACLTSKCVSRFPRSSFIPYAAFLIRISHAIRMHRERWCSRLRARFDKLVKRLHMIPVRGHNELDVLLWLVNENCAKFVFKWKTHKIIFEHKF